MRLLILFALCISGFIYGQTPDSLKSKKWAIGISYSPDFCFRTKYVAASADASKDKEKPKAGMTAGINFLYKLMDKIGVEVGLLYSTKGEKVYSSSINWITANGSNHEGRIPDYNSGAYYKSASRKSTYTYQYIEIPFKVNWYAVNNRIKVFPSLGVSANVFLGKKTVAVYNFDEGGSEKSTSTKYDGKNIPAADMAILVGVGLSYDINENVFIKVEPAYRQFVRPLVDSPISGAFYSFGMNGGIYFRL